MSNEKISEILNNYVSNVSGIAKFLLLNENLPIEVSQWVGLHVTLKKLHRARFLVYREDGAASNEKYGKMGFPPVTARVTLSDELRAYFRAMLL